MLTLSSRALSDVTEDGSGCWEGNLWHFCPSLPQTQALHRQRVHSEQGDTRRAGRTRLRPAVTHDYSEMVAAHPLSWTETRACGGCFLSGVATTEEEIP